ncbi:MAG: DUF3592 domain-containing protein [Pyrinomonadaceae bacterium]
MINRARIAAYISAMHPLEILMRVMFTSVGCLLAGVAIWMVAGNLIVISTYEHARAEVTMCERSGPVATKGLDHYSVQVQFERNGKLRRSSVDRANFKYEVGDVIDIYFKPETPYSVIAGDFMQMWFLSIIVGIAGGVMLFFGLKPDRGSNMAKAE